MKPILIIAVAVASPLYAGCNMRATPQMMAAGKSERRVQIPRQLVIESRIGDQRALWEWESTRLKDEESLIAIQRVGAGEAVVLDDGGTLYRSADDGKTWVEAPISVPGGAAAGGAYDVTSFHFINPSVGWATVTRTPKDVLDAGGFESWILRTDDGGSKWDVWYSDKAVQLTRVLFVNEQEGWVGGGRLVKGETQHYESLVMHTTDQGINWADVSNNLEPHITDGYVKDIYASEPSKALLVGSGRKFASTVTGGQSWQTMGKITEVAEQIGIQQLGVRGDGRLWALGGTHGREGTSMIMALQDGENAWTVYKAHEVFLRDAVFLSDTEVIACGAVTTGDVPWLEGGGRDGVILHSTDAGRNWSVVYRNPHVKEVNALAVADPDNIWAVGDAGLILRLKTRPKGANSL